MEEEALVDYSGNDKFCEIGRFWAKSERMREL